MDPYFIFMTLMTIYGLIQGKVSEDSAVSIQNWTQKLNSLTAKLQLRQSEAGYKIDQINNDLIKKLLPYQNQLDGIAERAASMFNNFTFGNKRVDYSYAKEAIQKEIQIIQDVANSEVAKAKQAEIDVLKETLKTSDDMVKDIKGQQILKTASPVNMALYLATPEKLRATLFPNLHALRNTKKADEQVEKQEEQRRTK